MLLFSRATNLPRLSPRHHHSAGFIFGKNLSTDSNESSKVAMTSPVRLSQRAAGRHVWSPHCARMGALGALGAPWCYRTTRLLCRCVSLPAIPSTLLRTLQAQVTLEMSGAPASAKIAMTSPVAAEMGAGEYKVGWVASRGCGIGWVRALVAWPWMLDGGWLG